MKKSKKDIIKKEKESIKKVMEIYKYSIKASQKKASLKYGISEGRVSQICKEAKRHLNKGVGTKHTEISTEATEKVLEVALSDKSLLDIETKKVQRKLLDLIDQGVLGRDILKATFENLGTLLSILIVENVPFATKHTLKREERSAKGDLVKTIYMEQAPDSKSLEALIKAYAMVQKVVADEEEEKRFTSGIK